MVKAHPLIGVGTNTFARAYPSYHIAGDPFIDIGPYAHNQYLHLAAELGWVGVAVFSILLVGVFLAIRRCLAARASAPYEAIVSAGLGAGLIGFLVVGLFESSLFHARGPMRFWFLVGLIMAVDAIRTRGADGTRG
jgi:O-antigen ligase